mmetsp:Transcript_36337/g.56936  ORF Transcript_36337/g.56936 Transcript_36337/m.56936 type:complete len:200 (+) Transcript_36337:622-1221(+)
MINLDAIFAIAFNCNFLRQTNNTIFHWCKYSGGNVVIIHKSLSIVKQSPGKKPSGLNCRRSQLRDTMNTITNRINIINICALVFGNNLPGARIDFDTNSFKVHLFKVRVAPNSEENSIELVRTTVINDLCLAGVELFEFFGDFLFDEFHTLFFHEITNHSSHLLVKTTQQNRPHHNSGVVAKSMQKSGTFKSNVGSTNN